MKTVMICFFFSFQFFSNLFANVDTNDSELMEIPRNAIEFNAKIHTSDLENILGERLLYNNIGKSNVLGQCAGSFATMTGKCGVYLFDPDNGTEIIFLDEPIRDREGILICKHNRTPIINDLGLVAWTEYTNGSKYRVYVWNRPCCINALTT